MSNDIDRRYAELKANFERVVAEVEQNLPRIEEQVRNEFTKWWDTHGDFIIDRFNESEGTRYSLPDEEYARQDTLLHRAFEIIAISLGRRSYASSTVMSESLVLYASGDELAQAAAEGFEESLTKQFATAQEEMERIRRMVAPYSIDFAEFEAHFAAMF